MSDFLATMAASSEARWRAAEAREPFAALKRRAALVPPAPPLRPHGGFDLIAEVKLVAPSAGRLAAPEGDRRRFVVDQARAYAAGGAAAVSVLTEPDRFDGDLADLAAVAAAIDVPAMRKDFLVHPYQVWEGRAAGAGGVLLIVRMLDPDQLAALCDAAVEAGMFVLLEAFDADDVARTLPIAASWRADAPPLLVGVNSRDLATLKVAPGRLEALGPTLPAEVPSVAESGLEGPDDVRRVKAVGYTFALVGSALMRSGDPSAAVAAMLAAGRG